MARMLLYDGDCGMCTVVARWSRTKLPHDVQVVPAGDVDLAGLGLTVDDVLAAAWWVEDGRRYRGHLAAARAWQAMGGVWRVPGFLARTRPTSWVADGVYRLVARYRHRLPGATEACRVDAPR